MITVAEIARNIGIPATTAREYVGRFRQFFPTRKVSGKRYPMHPNSAEDVMRDIVETYSRNMTTDEVVNYLKEKHPISADVIDEEEKTNSHTTTMTTAADNSSIEILTRMNNMQMQLMQRMTDVLDRNNQVMERMMNVLDKDIAGRPALKAPEQVKDAPKEHPASSFETKETTPIKEHPDMASASAFSRDIPEHIDTPNTHQNSTTSNGTPMVQPKKFIMPSKEEMEKRKSKGWLSRMFGA